jgi:hypothetical protein
MTIKNVEQMEMQKELSERIKLVHQQEFEFR